MNTNNTYKDNEEEDFSFLSSERKKNVSFSIPDDYFDSLAGRIQIKIENLEGNINKKTTGHFEQGTISLFRYFEKYKYTAIGLAASVALLIALFFYSSQSVLLNKKEMFVSSEEISNSVFFTEIDEASLIDELEENKKAGILSSEQNMEDYLIENDINESTLIFEL